MFELIKMLETFLSGRRLKEKIDRGEAGVNAGIGFYDYRK